MELDTRYGKVKIFTENIDDGAYVQIVNMSNSRLGENAHIRIMPDVHVGRSCSVGTTMLITDKICPNLIGVDIGCGVNIVFVKEDLSDKVEELDKVIRKHIPYGFNIHKTRKEYPFENMKCWKHLDDEARDRSQYSLGSLGGGNHFIEAYKNAVAVHSGSRNIGQAVAVYYQRLAEKTIKDVKLECLEKIEDTRKQEWLNNNKNFTEKELAYLTGENMKDYLHDMKIVQQFASDNRECMLKIIIEKLKLTYIEKIISTHNYIDTETSILRKGAIASEKNKKLVIPLNMRDGVLICEGKGNEDWNYSAPHGAGRLYSRGKAKEVIKFEDYQKSMEGIYSTCVNKRTIDESPFAYKNYTEIIENIEPTATIIERLIPIFNFKA